jgi:hypothetical protein
LYEFCVQTITAQSAGKRSVYEGWLRVAARDLAMSIYHFGCAHDGINEALGATPTVRQIVSTKLKLANKLFAQSFPNYVQVRNSIAHSAETTSSQRNIDKHAAQRVDMPGFNMTGAILIDGYLDVQRGTFAATWKGQVVMTEINRSALSKLEHVRDAFLDGFGEMSLWHSEQERRG